MDKFMMLALSLNIFLLSSLYSPVHAETTQYRQLPVEIYRDKMKAGWIGQIVGVAWGAPTEFNIRIRLFRRRLCPSGVQR